MFPNSASLSKVVAHAFIVALTVAQCLYMLPSSSSTGGLAPPLLEGWRVAHIQGSRRSNLANPQCTAHRKA